MESYELLLQSAYVKIERQGLTFPSAHALHQHARDVAIDMALAELYRQKGLLEKRIRDEIRLAGGTSEEGLREKLDWMQMELAPLREMYETAVLKR